MTKSALHRGRVAVARATMESIEPRRLLCGVLDHDALDTAAHTSTGPSMTATFEHAAPPAKVTPGADTVYTGSFVVTLKDGVSSDAAAKKHGGKHGRAFAEAPGQAKKNVNLWQFDRKQNVKAIEAALKKDAAVLDAYPVYGESAAPGVAAEEPVVAPDMNEAEPNNTPASATVVPVSATPNVVSASISSSSDVDYYTFTLAQRAGVFLDIDAFDIGLSSLDSELNLYQSNGTTLIEYSDAARDFDSIKLNDTSATVFDWEDGGIYRDLAAGTYVVKVNGWSGSVGAYQLKVTADSSYTSTVPVLASNPGAADTLYLDFDGHSASDAWGTYSLAPYDLSGNGGEWSPGERLAIENIWRVVADLYSPFNVNVTTSYAGSFNAGVAQRHVIANSSGGEVGAGGALGVAYVDVYGSAPSQYHTSFAFANNFVDYTQTSASGKMVAAAIEIGNTSAHEIGHALGLLHYGGSNPQLNGVMHTPDFGLSRERWVSGTTKSDESPVIFQDDIAVISKAANTFGLRADDHNDSMAGATALTGSGGTFTGSGIINSVTDGDYFRFTGNGATTIKLEIPEHLGHLDGVINLYDSSGSTVAFSNSATLLGTTLTTTLPSAGDYFVRVSSDSGPGEIGQYTLSVTTTTGGGGGGGSIAGQSFHDANGNGNFDAGEPTINGATIYLDQNQNNTLDAGEASTTTSGAGNYSFTNLANAQYYVKEVPPTGYVVSNTHQVIINAGNAFNGVNFANIATTYTGTASADNYTLRLASGGTFVEILVGGSLAYTFNKGLITGRTLTFNLGGGDDQLTIDHVNGNPVPSGGLIYNGEGNGTAAGDLLTIAGSAASESWTLVNPAVAGVSSGQIGAGSSSGAMTVERTTVTGGAGNDSLTAGVGLFTVINFNGGADTDTFTFNGSESNDEVALSSGALTDVGYWTHNYSALENLVINLRFGFDKLTGGIGVTSTPFTTINGGDGDDDVTITSGLGMTFNGDAGNDTLTLPMNAVANVTFNGGTGTDSSTQNSLSGQASIYNISSMAVDGGGTNINYNSSVESMTVNGQGFGDTFHLNTTSSATALTINSGGGNDTFNVGSGNLSSLGGNLTVNGGADTDAIVINDSTNTAAQFYDITPTTFDRATFGLLTYAQVEGLTVNGSTQANTVTVSGTAAGTPVTVNGNNGNDTLTISGAPAAPVTFNGGTNAAFTDTLNVNAGTHTFNADANVGTANLDLRIGGSGAVVFNATQHLANLAINAGTATMSSHGSRILRTSGLSIAAGAKLNLNDNDMIVDYTGTSPLGTFDGTNYSGITGLIDRGHNGALWNGDGIVTTGADAESGLTTLAVAEASAALTLEGSATGNFGGETVDATTVLVKYTYAGDANLDGAITGDDYSNIDFGILFAGMDGFWNGDFNYDGFVTGDDYSVIDLNILLQGSAL